MYALNDEMEMRARLSTLARKVEELEGKQLHEVQAVTDNTAQPNPCTTLWLFRWSLLAYEVIFTC